MNVPDSHSVHYPWNGEDRTGLVFVGMVATMVYYDLVTEVWTINGTWGKSYGTKDDIWGTSGSPQESYILGKHRWNITNEMAGCTGNKTWLGHLKLTSCDDNHFTCDDGECITMEERCDQVTDCRDESDEDNCQLLVLKPSYKKLVPPITVVSKTNKTIVPVPVSISINLHKIVSMEEADHKIELQFTIDFKWRENNRTSYQGVITCRPASEPMSSSGPPGGRFMSGILYLNCTPSLTVLTETAE
jgi:hypothetical protein